MELHCENCGELIVTINDPNPPIQADDPLSDDVLCPKCRFLLEVTRGYRHEAPAGTESSLAVLTYAVVFKDAFCVVYAGWRLLSLDRKIMAW